jgi:hypothetical protein
MTCPGAKKAVDDFMADKPEKIVQLSCGSAFLIRQRAMMRDSSTL